MKKTIILIILFFITMNSASADIFGDLDRAITEYNAYYQELPTSLKILLGNEDILTGILMNDGSEVHVWLVTKDGRVTEFEKVEDLNNYNPTVIIATNENTVRKLINTTNPLAVYEEARANGNLSIDPVGFTTNARFMVANLAFNIFKSLGLA